MTPLDRAIAYLLDNEGKDFVNDANDAGGPTKFGVTLKSYQAFVGREVSPLEIMDLTMGEVKPFYEKMYWDRIRGPSIKDDHNAIAIFDCAVLYGLSAASFMSQQALRASGFMDLKVDGIFGDKSVDALNRLARTQFIPELQHFVLDRIEAIIQNKPSNLRFSKGWTSRADKLLSLADPGPLSVT